MLWLVTTLKLLTEVALLALLGRGVLALWPGAQRNAAYLCLDAISQPVVRLARRCSPRFVLDRHLPWVAFGGLGVCWLLLVVLKIGLCLQIGIAACR